MSRGDRPMAEKWADYLVSKVEYNASGTHIDRVLAHADNGDSVGPGTDTTRQTVIAGLDAGTTYCTITRNKEKWHRGAPVKAVTIDGVRYIKTVADQIKSDNLGDCKSRSKTAAPERVGITVQNGST